MMNIKNLSDKTTFCLFLTVITVGYVYLSHRYMPIIANDALNGLVTSHNYELTEIWNTHYYLSDSLQITSTFLTWWAPGQYVIPLFFSALLGVSLGFPFHAVCHCILAHCFIMNFLFSCRLRNVSLIFRCQF